MGNATQISTSVTIISSLLGYQAISLAEMAGSAATFITAGSKVEIKSAFFTFGSDETPNASSWTAITTANTAYIALTPSGSAGSQVVAASWTMTAPVWSDSAQGWYASAASVSRVIGGCYKGGPASYQRKFIISGIAAGGDLLDLRGTYPASADNGLRFANDASLKWDESTDNFKISKLLFSTGLTLYNNIADVDRQIRFASDVTLYWDESADRVFLSKGLTIDSTTGALVVPSMTAAQVGALPAVNGSIAYDTDNERLLTRENGAWLKITTQAL